MIKPDFTPRYVLNHSVRTLQVEHEPRLWQSWQLRLRLADLREKCELAALAWYDEGLPRYSDGHNKRSPAGAGNSLGVYHCAVKRVYRELRRRAQEKRRA